MASLIRPAAAGPRSSSSMSYDSRNVQSPEPYYKETFKPTTVTTITAGNPKKQQKKLKDRRPDRDPEAMKQQKPFTEAEFEVLPRSVQRKYFSTLERLRLADNGSTSPSGRLTPVSLRRPSTSVGRHSRAGSRVDQGADSRSRSRLRRRDSGREDHALTAAEARWYMSLPDKVKRQQFSREEQTQLSRQCQTALSKTADPALAVTNPKARTLLGAREGAISTPPRLPHGQADLSDDAPSPQSGRRQSEPSVIAPVDEETSVHHIRRPSFTSTRDALFGRSPSTPATSPITKVRSASVSHARRPSFATETPITFYQDAAIRRKLRQYLASPSKFDEAVEFGFPSRQSTEDERDSLNIRPHRQTIDSRLLNYDFQRFLSDAEDSLSFLDASDDSCSVISEDAIEEETSDDNGLDDLIDEYNEPLTADTSSLSDLDDPSTPSEAQFSMVGPTPGHYLPSKKPSLASLTSPPASANTSGTTTPHPLSRKPSLRSNFDKPLPPSPPSEVLSPLDLDATPRAVRIRSQRPSTRPSPRTPQPHSHSQSQPQPQRTPTHHPRKPSLVSISHGPNSASDAFERALLSNREMTLRLTLTRPELRADDEEIYGWQNNVEQKENIAEDLLALGDLPPCVEDETGESGAFGRKGMRTTGGSGVWRLKGRR
ncbi:MAG: hypothetical protein M1820_010254 [Bogoriella megaspora]|nr:MAG: hypothetical protein M1820_010254 [Bogoriella megaspora]